MKHFRKFLFRKTSNMTRYLIPKFTPKRDKEFLYISSFELLHVKKRLKVKGLFIVEIAISLSS